MSARKLFGTDGVRGVAGEDLTEQLARQIGCAAALYAAEVGAGEIVIGRDTRESGEWLEAALVEGVCAGGGHAATAGVIPTPGVAVLARLDRAALGCVISASHNPFQDNGIKLIGGDGRKLADAAEAEIERLAETGDGPGGGSARWLEGALETYMDWLAATYGEAVPGGLRLGVDCAHGAAYLAGPQLLRRVGVQVQAIGDAPDGRNINAGVGSTHLDAVAELVREQGLDGGLAFDGDADRCLAVDSRGRPVNGDAVIAALAIDRHRRGALEAGRVVVTSMTNLGFHRLMAEHGIAVEVTDVGDRYVLERMLETGATLGGEQSGHVIDLVHHTTGDGLATALMLLAALARMDTVLDAVAELITPFPQRLVAVPADRTALSGAQAVWQAVRAAEAELGADGRVVLRASGTEQVVRVMVEAADPAQCQAICDRLAGIVSREIGV